MSTDTKFWLWSEIYLKMSDELDLEDGDFVSEDEMRGWANDAIDAAESFIHQTNEGYFLSSDNITLVNGTSEYAMPLTIFAHKIQSIVYVNGTTVYEIKRISSLSKFLQYRAAIANGEGSADAQMRYFLKNATAANPKIIFTPPVDEDGEFIEIWFYRNANRLDFEDDACDIPEFVGFVFDWIRERFAWKREAGSPAHVTAQNNLSATKDLMISTLKDMVVDGANEIEPDISHYEDHN